MRAMLCAMTVAALAAPTAWAQRESSPDLNREIRRLREDLRQFESRLRAMERRLGAPGDGVPARGTPGFTAGGFGGGVGTAPFGGGIRPAGFGGGAFGSSSSFTPPARGFGSSTFGSPGGTGGFGGGGGGGFAPFNRAPAESARGRRTSNLDPELERRLERIERELNELRRERRGPQP